MSGGVFPSVLWINNKGTFVDKTKEYGISFLENYFIQSAAAGDYNNDGFTDLFLSNWGAAKNKGDHLPPVLLKNIQGEKFEKQELDVFNDVGNYSSAAWGDFNLDGFVDLYVVNYIETMNHNYDSIPGQVILEPTCWENKFYINQQGKGFIEVSEKFKLNDDGCGLAATFSDFDLDGDLDLFLANDFGQWNNKGNKLFRNNYPEDTFTDISDSIGFYREYYGMGIGAGDYDNDGDLDYYVTNIGANSFFQYKDGKFNDIAKQLNLELDQDKNGALSTSWSGIFADFDNDGFLDLYISNGNVQLETPETAILDPNKLFMNVNGSFIDKSESAGIADPISHRGAVIFDFDHDGDMDIVSNIIKMGWGDFAGLDQKIKLYRNDTKTNNKWIGIKMTGTEGVNSYCIGCSAELTSKNGTQLKTVESSSGHGSQSTNIMYFGLDKSNTSGKISLKWTDGTTFEVENLKTNSVYQFNKKGSFTVIY